MAFFSNYFHLFLHFSHSFALPLSRFLADRVCVCSNVTLTSFPKHGNSVHKKIPKHFSITNPQHYIVMCESERSTALFSLTLCFSLSHSFIISLYSSRIGPQTESANIQIEGEKIGFLRANKPKFIQCLSYRKFGQQKKTSTYTHMNSV